MSCVFCKIVSREIPVEVVDENEVGVVIKAKDPAAAEHFLAISKRCEPDVGAMCDHDFVKAGRMLSLARQFARTKMPNGYRIVTNCGPDSGQTMMHLHFHILGGEKLKDI